MSNRFNVTWANSQKLEFFWCTAIKQIFELRWMWLYPGFNRWPFLHQEQGV